MTNNDQNVYDIVCLIPEGFVATYGQIARLLKWSRGARQVGYALARLDDAREVVPWHRVVNARGEISERVKAGSEDYQRILLEDEGIEFDLHGRIDLLRYLWIA